MGQAFKVLAFHIERWYPPNIKPPQIESLRASFSPQFHAPKPLVKSCRCPAPAATGCVDNRGWCGGGASNIIFNAALGPWVDQLTSHYRMKECSTKTRGV